jgi:hypothetical protein
VEWCRFRQRRGTHEYDVQVRTLTGCTKMADGCRSDLTFVGKPERQKSFRGQNLQYKSYVDILLSIHHAWPPS